MASEYQTKLKELSEMYQKEFDTNILDEEWSATAYQDLSNWYKARYTWKEFHRHLQMEMVRV